MTKSELIEALAKQQPQLALKDVELAVKFITKQLTYKNISKNITNQRLKQNKTILKYGTQ